MLESIRKGQRWLTGLFIAVIGGVFVFFLGLGGGAGGGPISAGADTVVALDGVELTARDFDRQRELQYRRLQDSIGAGLQEEMAQQFASQQALRTLVETAILAYSAEELGLAAGKREIQELLRNDPTLRDADGRFDRESFEAYVEHEFGSQRLFLEVMRLDLLRSKMVQILFSQAHVSDGEARAASLQRLHELEIAAVLLDTKNLPADDAPSDAEIEAYASENEANLKALYDEDPTQFGHQAQAKARHILVTVDPSAADEAAETTAREAIEAARKRILDAGEDFAAVAGEVSQDAGTKGSGGDLGWFERAEVEPAIANAAFGLAEGGISEPVRGVRGWHLVQLQEKRDAGIDPFEDVRLELARRQAVTARAGERARTLADELLADVKAGKSLEEAARARELTLVRPGRFRRRADGMIPQVGADAELMAAAFGASPETPSIPRIYPIGDNLVLAQVLAHHMPEEAEVEADISVTHDRLKQQRRERIVRAWIDERQQKLDDEGRLFVNHAIVNPR